MKISKIAATVLLLCAAGGVAAYPSYSIDRSSTSPAVQASQQQPLKLGVALAQIEQKTLDSLKLEFGVRIAGVKPDSRAASAGLQKGDVVTHIGERPAYSPQRLKHLVAGIGGDTTISLRRGDQELRLPVDFSKSISADAGKPAGKGFLGVRLQSMTEDLQEAFGSSQGQGVLISQVIDDSAASKAGLNAGDVITEIGGAGMSSVKAVHEAIGKHKAGDQVDIKVLRDRESLEMKIALGGLPSMKHHRKGHFEGHHRLPHSGEGKKYGKCHYGEGRGLRNS